jgi:hypothetical protein
LVGNRIQDIGRADPIDIIAFNLTVIGGHSVVTLGWMKPGGPEELFARSFKALAANEKANAAVVIAVRAIENTYLKPTWWDAQSVVTREMLVAEMAPGDLKFDFHRGDGRRETGAPFVVANAIEVQGSI